MSNLPIEKAPALTDEEARTRMNTVCELSEFDYQRQRGQLAKELGVTVTGLDKARSAQAKTQAPLDVHDDLTCGVIPWDDPVDGVSVAAEVRDLFNNYCILPDGGDIALTLWSIATYSIDQFRIFPKAYLSSPEKRCGKTTTLETISAVVDRSLMASNLSAAVMFRAIETWHPSLLIDEADTFLYSDNDQLRGIINSGHTRSGAYVLRVEEFGGERVPVKFSTWTPQCFAGIKTPPETIRDRSVMLVLRRKLGKESVHKLPIEIHRDCQPIRQRLRRWSDDHADALRNQSPAVPVIGNERAMDNWLPLLAVADVVGGEWPELARKAMLLIEAGQTEDDDGVGPMILSDIRSIFADKQVDRISSNELVIELTELEDRPWAEWRRGQPLTKNSLARLLKPFGIKSAGTVRVGATTKKGYKLSSFSDAFERYLSSTPLETTATTSQVSVDEGYSDFETSHETSRVGCNGHNETGERDGSKHNVTVVVTEEKTPKASPHAGCDVVTVETGVTGEGVVTI